MASFTVTERGVFRRCRRRWDYSSLNRQALTPLQGAPALALGMLVHKALESWIDDPSADLAYLFIGHAANELDVVKQRYRQTVGADPSDVELGSLYEAIGLGRAMVTNYQAYYKQPIPEGFNRVQAEQTLVAEVPGTGHYLQGTVDLLLEHNNKLYVMDHKTYRSRPRPASIQQNDQFLAYLWLVSQVCPGQVGGFIYDGLWKREEPPKRGGTVDDLFMRLVTIRPPEELAEFEYNASCELTEMGDPDLRIYPNRQWQGCWDCGFSNLCTAQSRGESWQLIRDSDFVKRADAEVPDEDSDEDEFPF